MKKEKHLFFIYSDFHYVICKSIILSNNLKKEDCFFVCGRGMTVEKEDTEVPFPMEDFTSFYKKIISFIKNYKLIHSFFSNYDIVAYIPFCLFFPVGLYVKDVVFFEEGFSSHSKCIPDLTNKGAREKLKNAMKRLISYFVKKNVRAFLFLYQSIDVVPAYNTRLYVCSDSSYEPCNYPKLEKIVLNIPQLDNEKYAIPFGSYFVVLDRLSNIYRCYSLDNYFRCINRIANFCRFNGVDEIWIKLHPVDGKLNDAKIIAEKEFIRNGIRVKWYNGRLEMLAMQNKNITFIGTHSTILYYAPILGNTNRSVSFCKFLASIDKDYSNFISLFGGIDRFVDVFSKNVECE